MITPYIDDITDDALARSKYNKLKCTLIVSYINAYNLFDNVNAKLFEENLLVKHKQLKAQYFVRICELLGDMKKMNRGTPDFSAVDQQSADVITEFIDKHNISL